LTDYPISQILRDSTALVEYLNAAYGKNSLLSEDPVLSTRMRSAVLLWGDTVTTNYMPLLVYLKANQEKLD